MNPVRASVSTSTEASGTLGSIADSSSRSASASVGTSSADSGGMISSPSSLSRICPGLPAASWASRSASAVCSSAVTAVIAAAAPAGLPTSWQYSARLGAHCSAVSKDKAGSA